MRVFIVFGIVFLFMLVTILLQPARGPYRPLRPEPPVPTTAQAQPPVEQQQIPLTHHLPRS